MNLEFRLEVWPGYIRESEDFIKIGTSIYMSKKEGFWGQVLGHCDINYLERKGRNSMGN